MSRTEDDSPASIGYINSHFLETSNRIRQMLRSGRPAICATSLGKDSTAMLNCVLVVAAEMSRAGESVPPIFIAMANTGIENPKVDGLRGALIADVTKFAEENDIEVRINISEPRLSESYWVRILAGEKILSTPKNNSDCTVDLKIKPSERSLKKILVECKERGLLAPCVLVGTRHDESARRDRHMRERGENALLMRRPDGTSISPIAPLEDQWDQNSYRFEDRLTWAPLADWPTESVFGFLQRAGQANLFRYGEPDFPAYCGNFDALLQVYSEANGGECLLVIDPSTQKRVSAGCTARTGCWPCSMVPGRDPSMEGMLMQPENEFMRPLNQFRNLAVALQDDLDRRNWVGRGIDPITNAVMIRPNSFNFETRQWMLRMLLTIGVEERERAERVKRKVADGTLPANVFTALATPQFETLNLADVVMIEFLSARAGLGRHLWAIQAWRDIVIDGQREPVPENPPIGKSEAVPDPRYFVLDGDILNAQFGLRDPIMALVGHDHDGSPDINDGNHYDIDVESLGLFEELELERWLEEAHLYNHSRTVRSLMGLGVVKISTRALRTIHASLQRHETMQTMGLNLDMRREEATSLKTLSQKEHAALKDQPHITAHAKAAPRGCRTEDLRQELQDTIRRRKGLEILGDWTDCFDGMVVSQEITKLKKAAKSIAKLLPAAVEHQIEAVTNMELNSLIPAIVENDQFDVDLAAKYGMGLLVAAAHADLTRYSNTTHETQRELFAA